MIAIWQNLSVNIQRLFIGIVVFTSIVLIGIQFQVNPQGSMSDTYPKGFRGGTCTIESDTLLVGYSAYFIPEDYAIPEDAMSAASVPIFCGKVPGPGLLNITVDLLYPVSVREQPLTVSLARKTSETTMEPLLSIPARNYQSGIITQEVRINEPGEYILRLSGTDTHNTEFNLEIPVSVGTNWYESITPYWPMLLLGVIAMFLYNLKRLID
ncbi:hypothetical protein [Nitrosomonas sp.]|uniref:hypothetical protein n=1 Tax=Nitrosomonas sp. TaxID=42353 RepID=UPI00260C8883|nr:hypothetical protein [Nitrosomonas sp.]MBE7527917.1 hypothetical protein [Burkholderiales bacterium]